MNSNARIQVATQCELLETRLRLAGCKTSVLYNGAKFIVMDGTLCVFTGDHVAVSEYIAGLEHAAGIRARAADPESPTPGGPLFHVLALGMEARVEVDCGTVRLEISDHGYEGGDAKIFLTVADAEGLARGLLAKAAEARANLEIEGEADAAAESARREVYARHGR